MGSVLVRRQRQLQHRPSHRRSSISFLPDNVILKVMVRRSAPVLLTAVVLAVSVLAADRPGSDLEPALYRLLTAELRFSANDLADLELGKAVKHTLPPTSPGEVAAVGGIRINTTKERFVAAYRDIVRFKRNPNVLQIGRF